MEYIQGRKVTKMCTQGTEKGFRVAEGGGHGGAGERQWRGRSG